MLGELLDLYGKCRDFDQVTALAARLMQENARLRLENARLRKENRNLRRRLRDSELRTLRRAEIDANLMGVMWLTGLPTSRRECEAMGISRHRWAWARALMQVGHVLEGSEWAVDDAATFDARLAAGVRLVEAQGMTRLRAFMPRNGTSGRRFPRARGQAIRQAAGQHLGQHSRAKVDRPLEIS